ncbi:type II toxin-antitoxin system VapB family antitoxin [Sabulicella rubraurantiaca]|uniref:type II toxin-antitoxin system VapB family antitoxin n=1 Tax=Sabulicella rubraurantiaca TaxID=2811429 RepID=UPI001A96E205|nr:type II toxin-antitoxin system VapB family antitoxin [Sabulicella rubraurantiaca]
MSLPPKDHTQQPAIKRTRVSVDRKLLAQAQEATGLSSPEAVVEEALRLVIRLKRQKAILRLAGKVKWEGDLDESRKGRNVE